MKIYENDFYFTKDKTKIKNKDKDFLIHPNFRLIMTTSKETNISLAIKSRCLCIKIRPFKEPRDYGELIANNLKYSDIADKNIIDIAQQIGYGFYKLKEEEEQSNYILKNYILSSVNLANISKLIFFYQPIDDKKLAQIIEFCIFFAFKKGNKKYSIIESFNKNLKEDINFEITPIRNIKRSHEYYLKKCELNIFSYYYNKNKEVNDIIKKMNEKILKINSKSEINENLINKYIKKNEIIRDIPRKNLLANLESFTIPEIKEYLNDIDEVINILKVFIEEKDELYQSLYFLNYLKLILNDLLLIDNDKLNGIKINKMDCNKDFFLKYNIDEDLSNKYSKILIRFKNLIYYFNDIIPEKISIIDMKKSIVAIYYKYYKAEFQKQRKDDKNFEDYFPFILLSNPYLKGKVKKMNFSYLKNDLWKLYNILKYYDDTIDVDINKKEINIKKYMLSISLLKEIDINEIKKTLNIKDIKMSPEITFSQKEIDNTIIYFYPKIFYKEESVSQLFFFFEFFLKEYLNDKENTQE